MRILLAMNRLFLPQRAGGVESSVHDIANALHARGETVSVLSRLNPFDWLGLGVMAKRALLGGRVRYAKFGRGYHVYRTPMMTRDLPQVLRHARPDVAILQGTGRLDLGRLLTELGIPTVLHVRDVEFREARLSFEPAAVIANSHFTAERFKRQFSMAAKVIHNVFDAPSYRVPYSGDRVVFINPVKKKGLDVALALAHHNPEIFFLFVKGWPQGRQDAARLAEKVRQYANVELWPRQHDMRGVYRHARVVLVPSQWEEAWGRVVSESQVSGIPVLASNRGGIPEALGPGGVLLPPEDLDAWNDSLRRIWNDAEYRTSLSVAALEYSKRKELQTDRIIANLLELLHEVCRR